MPQVIDHNKFFLLDEDNFQKEVLDFTLGPVLVMFGAIWHPKSNRTAIRISNIINSKICKVDIDKEPGLASRYGVDSKSIPKLLVFRNGKLAARANDVTMEVMTLLGVKFSGSLRDPRMSATTGSQPSLPTTTEFPFGRKSRQPQ